ncbi:hypothetical protein PhaeoP54_02494 [Phaeobacter inhibens]|nr:hypothetical protein PhaeoP54_02494 [Phaeobacter inhibens]
MKTARMRIAGRLGIAMDLTGYFEKVIGRVKVI